MGFTRMIAEMGGAGVRFVFTVSLPCLLYLYIQYQHSITKPCNSQETKLSEGGVGYVSVFLGTVAQQ